MKIHQNHNVNQERFPSLQKKSSETASFQQVFQEKQGDLSQERLKALFHEVELNGTRLGHSRSIEDLLAYKRTIKTFLQEVVQNGLSLEKYRGFHPNGREKELMMIKHVDRKLVELSEQVLDKQAPSINLLDNIGEIKGLLINLYL